MKTIFTIALFALLSVGSACSKSSAPIDITGDWTFTMLGGSSTPTNIKPDGTMTSPGLGDGTWVLKGKHFSATSLTSQLEGDIMSTSPFKIEGTITIVGGIAKFVLTKL